MGKEYNRLIDYFINRNLKVQSYKTLSEYKNESDHYVDLYKYTVTDFTEEDYLIFNKVINIEEILVKDRLFREEINYYQSYELITACFKFMVEYFKANQYKIVIGQCIDSYVGDILVRVGQYFGVVFIGLVKFFYSGYVRITTYGEYNFLRKPDEQEIIDLVLKLESNQRTIFAPTKSKVITENIKLYFLYKVKFLIHYLFFNKFLNKKEYDYISISSAYPKSIRMISLGYRIYEDKLPSKLINKKYIYIPLHYYPESTIEYWADDIGKASYYPHLFKILTSLSERGYTLLVKEHPAMYQKRQKQFLKTLSNLKNVHLLSPFIPTKDVLNYVDTIVVWTGTSGIEAFMNDKIVIAVSDSYYSEDFYKLDDLFSQKLTLPTKADKSKLAEKIMSNCIKL